MRDMTSAKVININKYSLRKHRLCDRHFELYNVKAQVRHIVANRLNNNCPQGCAHRYQN